MQRPRMRRARRSPASASARAERLDRLFDEHHTAVLGYLARRSTSADQAADAFSEVCLVAWRRLDDVPAGPDARPWLLGVARRVLANARRGARRHEQLVARLGGTLPASAFVTAEPTASTTGRIRSAIDQLGDDDAELVRLVAWDGLSPAQAAPLVGLTPDLARVRLHRARARLRALLVDSETDAPAPTPTTPGHVAAQRNADGGQGHGRRAPARRIEEAR